jgi:hypothetical protein
MIVGGEWWMVREKFETEERERNGEPGLGDFRRDIDSFDPACSRWTRKDAIEQPRASVAQGEAEVQPSKVGLPKKGSGLDRRMTT